MFIIRFYNNGSRSIIVPENALSCILNMFEKTKTRYKVMGSSDGITYTQKDLGKRDFDYWLNPGDNFNCHE